MCLNTFVDFCMCTNGLGKVILQEFPLYDELRKIYWYSKSTSNCKLLGAQKQALTHPILQEPHLIQNLISQIVISTVKISCNGSPKFCPNCTLSQTIVHSSFDIILQLVLLSTSCSPPFYLFLQCVQIYKSFHNIGSIG